MVSTTAVARRAVVHRSASLAIPLEILFANAHTCTRSCRITNSMFTTATMIGQACVDRLARSSITCIAFETGTGTITRSSLIAECKLTASTIELLAERRALAYDSCF